MAAATGSAVLALRPVLGRHGDPVVGLTMVFVALLAVGVVWPVTTQPRGRFASAFAIGVLAFVLVRVAGAGEAALPATGTAIALNSLAAVAEEAFFRRLVYALLLPGGVAWAIGGSALLFAAVHLTLYGWWVVPVDLAAGVVLGWQRWVTGSWTVPSATHVVANLLAVL